MPETTAASVYQDYIARSIGLEPARGIVGAMPLDINEMRASSVADPLYGTGYVQSDDKFIHATRVWQTKTPAESKGEWDQFKLLATIP